jgi:hypothetical protein
MRMRMRQPRLARSFPTNSQHSTASERRRPAGLYGMVWIPFVKAATWWWTRIPRHRPGRPAVGGGRCRGGTPLGRLRVARWLHLRRAAGHCCLALAGSNLLVSRPFAARRIVSWTTRPVHRARASVLQLLRRTLPAHRHRCRGGPLCGRPL